MHMSGENGTNTRPLEGVIGGSKRSFTSWDIMLNDTSFEEQNSMTTMNKHFVT